MTTEGKKQPENGETSSPELEVQAFPEPPSWPLWVIGCLSLLATLLGFGLLILSVALRGYGDGAPGHGPGFLGGLVLWAPAIYFGLLTASCLPQSSEARVTSFRFAAWIVFGVFVLLALAFIGREHPSPGTTGTVFLALCGVAIVSEACWSYLRRRKRWEEM